MSRVPDPPEHHAGGAGGPDTQGGLQAQRASDADRDRVVEALRDHYVSGELTLEEFAQRTEVALVARTHAELQPLTRDLAVPDPVPATPVQPRRRRRPVRRTIAFMSGINRRGRWRIKESTTAIAIMGGINLDLREAELEPAPGSDEVVITAVSLMGGINVMVPEGVPVELSGFSLMGGTEDRTAGGRDLPGMPCVHIRAYSCMGGITIRTARQRPQTEEDRRLRREEQKLRREEHRMRQQERRVRQQELRAMKAEIRDNIKTERDRIKGKSAELRSGVRTGYPPAKRPALPPWIERTVHQTLGPQGLDRIMNERVAMRLRASGIDPDALRNSLEALASWVSGERVDLHSVAAPDGTVTILFTDIEGSSRINERLGDQRWIEMLRDHNAIIRETVREHGGAEVRSLGDGFMLVFSSARRALHCAIAIQRAFDDYSHEHPHEPIRVRIGCHTGEAIRDADDFFGRNVVLAARIADQADGRQILVSSVVKELTDSTGDISFGESREVTLDGLTGTRTLYEIAW